MIKGIGMLETPHIPNMEVTEFESGKDNIN